ncbi:MAG: dephospho-CoA kinase [Crocinitomicaceae bacterium]|nr:dephospho-CoA kinase [Crocinitomicaceae bacterium]|tara:strand:- start:1528 stop:2121 length:594 start_codon:yes stop_codon:yes gene_type:complete
MIKVGLTGGIGSGKSTVSKILISKGFSVYNSDNRAKWLMNNDDNLKSNIISIFGDKAYLKGSLNRKYLSAKVFNDSLKLKALNNLVHPLVAIDFKNWLIHQKSKDFVFKEAAILIESGAYKEMDKIIVLSCPENIRLERVLKRDGNSPELVKKRMQNQISETEKINHADFVIKNNGSESDLVLEVEFVISELKNLNK